jgi:hypothetical protein
MSAWSHIFLLGEILQSRVSTSVWTGFVFGFSPTSVAGLGSQKADKIFMALIGWWPALGPNNWINGLPPAYKGKAGAGFQRNCATRIILSYLR